jgi:hypothetical protein
MFYLQFFTPPGHPKSAPSFDKDIIHMCAQLKDVDKKSVPVPNSALSIQLFRMEDGTSIEIKKRGQLAFINFLCFEPVHLNKVFFIVNEHYKKFGLGTPTRPTMATWIHSIPIPGPQLMEKEIFLCQKMTVSFFWAMYGRQLNKSNPFN